MKKIVNTALILSVVFVNQLVAQTTGFLVDSRDGKKYKTVKIGAQIWMAENLNYKTSGGSWCFDNDEKNCHKTGRLYDWNSAKNACPTGWHLSTDKDWFQLESFIDPSLKDPEQFGLRGRDIATKLRSEGSLGFNAVYSGIRNGEGIFSDLDYYSNFWSPSGREEEESLSIWIRSMYPDAASAERNMNEKKFAFSVRCVKN